MLSLKLPRVFSINQVPKVFHEDSIISGYRQPCSSATDCVLSVFQLTNETLNIWTHFLPTWYFLWKLLTVVFMQDVWHDAFAWPLVVFLASCCLYPLASSCAHTFSTMSTRARHICFFFDYGALSFYSLGSAITYSAYVIPDRWIGSTFHRYYVPIAVFNTVLCTSLACYSRLGSPFLHYNHDVTKSSNVLYRIQSFCFQTILSSIAIVVTRFFFDPVSPRLPECERPKLSKALRIVAFAYPYLFDNIPVFYRIFFCVGEGCTDNETNLLHYRHMALAFLTGFLFATHLPERLAPGCFDYIGHSHQLFHVCGVLGTHYQVESIVMDMAQRRQWLLAHAPPVTFASSFGAGLLCVVLSLGIICAFSLPLFWAPAAPRKQKRSRRPRAAPKVSSD